MTNIDGIKLLHVDVNFNPKDASRADLNLGGLHLDHRPSGRSYVTDPTRVMQPLNDENKNVIRLLFDEDAPDRETFTECKFDLTAEDLFDMDTFIELWMDGVDCHHEDGFMDVSHITLSVEDKDGKTHEIPVN